MKKNPLLDREFLVELDQYHEKEVWAKIIALDINENPQEEITGRVTQGGSINIDGTSAVRRSCSFSMVAKNVNINDFYWGLHTKFKLLMGLTNKINPEYPEIIWFPQGVYILTSFNTSQSTNSYNISVQGKDKMCLLNGEIGGTLTAPIDFGKIEERDEEGNLTITDIPIKDIIKEAVHEYAKEPWHNIIVNDLEDLGIELLEYRGSRPLYMLINESTGEVINMTSNETIKLYNDAAGKTISQINSENLLNKLTEFYPGMTQGYYIGYLKYPFQTNDPKYSIAKIEYGQTAGYRLTDITYPGDLIANQGDSLTSILDKLVQMLGQFEYFYDLDGRFVFQKKKTYIQTTWNNLITTLEDEVIADIDATPYGYEFEGNNLTVSFSNNPSLTNLKNDFSIWGVRTSVTGAEIPVHLRYAIDKKPWYYKTIDGQVYCTKKDFWNKKETFHPDWWDVLDWAEYFKALTGEYPVDRVGKYCKERYQGSITEFFPVRPNYSPTVKNVSVFDVKGGYINYSHGGNCTHYYSYFTEKLEADTQCYVYKPYIPTGTYRSDSCDWREIIYQMAKDYRRHNHDDDFLIKVRENNIVNGEYLYPTGYTGYEQYYIDLEGFWRQLYNPNYMIDDKKLNMGGDGPIETEIELNELGMFSGVDIKDIYLYPIKQITNVWESKKDEDNKEIKDDKGKLILKHSPEQALVIEELDGYDFLNITPFVNFILLDDTLTYYMKYSADEKPKEIKFDVAEKAAITSLYVKINQEMIDYIETNGDKFQRQWIVDDEYLRFVDYEYLNWDYNLFYQSNDLTKLNDITGITKDIYYRDDNSFWSCYFTKKEVKDVEGASYFDQQKIQYYYTTYNYIEPEYNDQNEIINIDQVYWHKNVWDAPHLLNFWFDFMDTAGKMNDYSVSVVGNRPKVVNDTSIKSIYFRETPTVIFINKSNIPGWEFTERKSGYTYIQLPDSMLSLFVMSGQGKSAWNMLEECMYNDTYCIESASISTIPIYYLQPNTRIYIRDDNSKIDGDYMVSRFTIPLNYNGTMSISATKIAERIY